MSSKGEMMIYKLKPSKKKEYWNPNLGQYRDCEVIERNGSLYYVKDKETGERDWVPNFDIKNRD